MKKILFSLILVYNVNCVDSKSNGAGSTLWSFLFCGAVLIYSGYICGNSQYDKRYEFVTLQLINNSIMYYSLDQEENNLKEFIKKIHEIYQQGGKNRLLLEHKKQCRKSIHLNCYCDKKQIDEIFSLINGQNRD